MDNNLGLRLLGLREKMGESQDQVAEAVDISRVAYTRYENGTREPKASIAIKLAKHFGITVEQLFYDDDESLLTMKTSQTAMSDFEAILMRAYRNASHDTQRAVCNVLSVDFIPMAKAN